MRYVIRADDGKYLRIWHACDDGHITRVERVAKVDASTYRSLAEARAAAVEAFAGKGYMIEVR